MNTKTKFGLKWLVGGFVMLSLAVVMSFTAAQADAASPDPVLWTADQATNDLTQWYAPDTKAGNFNGGGVYNSGIAKSTVSNKVLRNGHKSVQMTISTPTGQTSGTRLFRWYESEQYTEAYYSVWYYFPREYTPKDWWNIFQFKSKDVAGNDDPFWLLSVGNRANTGKMYLYLYSWQPSGSAANEKGPTSYDQNLVDLPVGKWVHIEAYLKQASDFTGHLTVWQDGTQIFDKDGIKTKYSGGTNQWGVNNYSSGFTTTTTTTFYVTDAAISKTYIP